MARYLALVDPYGGEDLPARSRALQTPPLLQQQYNLLGLSVHRFTRFSEGQGQHSWSYESDILVDTALALGILPL